MVKMIGKEVIMMMIVVMMIVVMMVMMVMTDNDGDDDSGDDNDDGDDNDGGDDNDPDHDDQWRTLRETLGGGGEILKMCAFGVGLRYANLSNIMLGISNSLFDILL